MIFILCHSLRWIPNIWELKHSGLKKVTGENRCNSPHGVYSVRLSFLSSELGPPPPHPHGSVAPPFDPRGETTKYTECQAFFRVGRIGSPQPLTRKGVLLPPFGSKGGDHRVYIVQGFLSSRPNWVPLGPRGEETHSLAGEGMGDPIPTEGQTLWYSM